MGWHQVASSDAWQRSTRRTPPRQAKGASSNGTLPAAHLQLWQLVPEGELHWSQLARLQAEQVPCAFTKKPCRDV